MVTHRPWARSGKDVPSPPREIRLRVEITIQPPSRERLHDEMGKRVPFVPMPNVPAKELSARGVLVGYKSQPALNRRFASLKGPAMVTGVYLNRPDLAKALAYVLLLALPVAAFLERRILYALQTQHNTLVAQRQRTTDRPTAQSITGLFRSL